MAIKSYLKLLPPNINKFLNDFGKTHAKETIAKVNSHIRSATRNAINDGIMSSDFTLNTHLVYDPNRTHPLTFLNLNEAERVIKYLESNWSYEKVWDCWMMIALLTGMREAEIAGLTWDNIDFPHKQINVRQAWSQQHQDFKP